MKTDFDPSARKRPVNLTLNESLVSHAKSLTDNLSGLVESLLADFVSRANRERLQKAKIVEAAIASRNKSIPTLGPSRSSSSCSPRNSTHSVVAVRFASA